MESIESTARRMIDAGTAQPVRIVAPGSHLDGYAAALTEDGRVWTSGGLSHLNATDTRPDPARGFAAARHIVENWPAYATRERARTAGTMHDVDFGGCCTFHDTHTLPNRTSYAAYINQAIARRVRDGLPHADAEQLTLGQLLAGNVGA